MDIISLILALSGSSSQDFNYNDLTNLPTINGEILKGDIILPDLDKYIKVATKDENGNLDFNNLIENTWYILPIGEKLGRYKDGIFITDEFKDYNMSESTATKQRLNTIRIVSFSNIHDINYNLCYSKMFWIAPNASAWEASNIATGFMFGKGLSSNYPDSIPNLEASSVSGLATFEQISRLNQTITGIKTFNALPKSTKVPTEEAHLVNKKYVDDLVSTISTLSFQVVTELPTTDIQTNIIYLVPSTTSSEQNVYDEYIYINNAWEKIGSTSIDLSNYLAKDNTTAYTPTNDYNPATKKYVDDLFNSYIQSINAQLATLTTPDNINPELIELTNVNQLGGE